MPGSGDAMLLQCSGSTASVDQSFKHDVTLLKKYLGSQETENACCKADSIRPADDSTKKERSSGDVLCHGDDEVFFPSSTIRFCLRTAINWVVICVLCVQSI